MGKWHVERIHNLCGPPHSIATWGFSPYNGAHSVCILDAALDPRIALYLTRFILYPSLQYWTETIKLQFLEHAAFKRVLTRVQGGFQPKSLQW